MVRLRRKHLGAAEATGQAGSDESLQAVVVSGRGHMERIDFEGDSFSNYRGHIIRYKFALEHIPGIERMWALDIPCGIGYGANILSRRAKEVVGIDIEPEAIAKGTRKYLRKRGLREPRENLTLTVMDAQALLFPDDSFDAAVSFEGIEHVPKPEEMVSEVRRVLKPGATFIVSTPNGEMTRQKGGRPHNPFHIQEFTRDELTEMLSPHFSDIEFWGQDIVEARNMWKRRLFRIVGSLDVFDLRHRLVPDKALAAIREDVYGNVRIRKVDEEKGEKPRVWIAVCR